MTERDLGNLTFSFNPGGKQPLNSLATVGAIVKEFALYAQECHARQDLESLAYRCRYLGDAFMGRKPDEFETTEWNATTRLGAHIRAGGMVSFKEANDPGEAFFRWLAVQAISAANDIQNGAVPKDVVGRLQVSLNSATSFLVGAGG